MAPITQHSKFLSSSDEDDSDFDYEYTANTISSGDSSALYIKIYWVLIHLLGLVIITTVKSPISTALANKTYSFPILFYLFFCFVGYLYFAIPWYSKPGNLAQVFAYPWYQTPLRPTSLSTSLESLQSSSSIEEAFSTKSEECLLNNSTFPPILNASKEISIPSDEQIFSEKSDLLDPSLPESRFEHQKKILILKGRLYWIKKILCRLGMSLPQGTRYSRYAKLVVPVRSRYCVDCDQVTNRFDHHCGWVGCCIGASNHALFYAYLFFQFFFLIWLLQITGQSLGSIVSLSASHRGGIPFKLTSLFGGAVLEDSNVLKINTAGSSNQWPFSFSDDPSWLAATTLLLIVMLIIVFVFLLFVFSMLSYHTYLAVSNQTTWETMRNKKIFYLKYLPYGSAPFHHSIFNNLLEFFSCNPWIQFGYYRQYFPVGSQSHSPHIQPAARPYDVILATMNSPLGKTLYIPKKVAQRRIISYLKAYDKLFTLEDKFKSRLLVLETDPNMSLSSEEDNDGYDIHDIHHHTEEDEEISNVGCVPSSSSITGKATEILLSREDESLPLSVQIPQHTSPDSELLLSSESSSSILPTSQVKSSHVHHVERLRHRRLENRRAKSRERFRKLQQRRRRQLEGRSSSIQDQSTPTPSQPSTLTWEQEENQMEKQFEADYNRFVLNFNNSKDSPFSKPLTKNHRISKLYLFSFRSFTFWAFINTTGSGNRMMWPWPATSSNHQIQNRVAPSCCDCFS